MFKIRLKQLRMIVWLILFKLVSHVVKSNHWVICERGTEARDNGYCFYKYMKEMHPDQKVYYIITRNSADYKKVKEDAVIFNSIKSFWAIASAKKIVSAHYAAVLPLPEAAKIFKIFKLHEKFYFLQHGVIKDDLKALYANCAPMRLFVCGAKPEYEDIDSNYGHPKGVVRYTGLARFDYLHDIIVKKQILVMPTWRTFIRNQDEFKSSEYFAKWQKVLMDEKLNQKLEENNIQMIFYVHYEMQKYANFFKTCSDNVIIAKFEEYDVQTLLKESALLITDYSSVFFDFAYMKKPVLYYQFDAYHYEKGYFDYRQLGFGEVCTEHKVLIDNIEKIIDKEFILDPFYKNRISNFFPLHDRNNCDRIYNAILEN